jgi:hypothetical protein
VLQRLSDAASGSRSLLSVFVVSIIHEVEKGSADNRRAFRSPHPVLVTRRSRRTRSRPAVPTPDGRRPAPTPRPIPGRDANERNVRMITLLGTIIFATVIAIGALDRNSGLRILQKYESPWSVGPRRSTSKPARQHRGRDS